jgi:tetratricopeptide (TPR) repeat protein
VLLSALYRQFLKRGRLARAPLELAHIRDQLRSGDTQGARRALDSHLTRHPCDPQALHLRGLAELHAGLPAEAAASIARAVALQPDLPDFRANLGLALWRTGKLEPARAELTAALAAVPGLVSAALNLADLLAESGDPQASCKTLLASLEHAAAMDRTDVALLWVALAGLEPLLPDIDGRACLRNAVTLDPGSEWIPILGYMSFANRCDWSYPVPRLVEYFEYCASREPPEGSPILAPAIADCVPVSARARFHAARRYGQMVERRAATLTPPPPDAGGGADRTRIRLGYLSADFHNHPTMHLLRGVLAAHDRERFELHAYSYGPDDGSGMRQAVQARFDRFSDVGKESPLETARRIANDKIDILVDLKGFTGAARPEILALRPAPVQVSYLGYPGTTGAGFLDYLIADGVLVLEGEEVFYSEKVVRMPRTYQPTDNTQAPLPLPPRRHEVGLPEDAFVFCSFNSSYKIEPGIFDVWMEILRAVPHAVMWIIADADEVRANLRREAGARGVDAARILFAPSLPRARHLARMGLADLFLDTHMVNAHTTASDSIWAGLPIISVSGASFSSRVAASVLRAADLPELACADLDAYRALAIALAFDAPRLAEIRARCGNSRTRSALFDTRSYTRALEEAYARMHRARLAGDAPRGFNVTAPAGGLSC